jgi:hypothetical protein
MTATTMKAEKLPAELGMRCGERLAVEQRCSGLSAQELLLLDLVPHP